MAQPKSTIALPLLAALSLWPAAAPLPALEVALERVTGRPFAPGESGNHYSSVADATADGRFLLIATLATNLVPGFEDLNGGYDLLVHDRENGSLDWITVSQLDSQRAAYSGEALLGGILSEDGRFVAYSSRGSQHAPGTTGGISQLFLFDRQTRTTVKASHPPADPLGHGNGASGYGYLSDDGRYLTYSSDASNLIAGADGNAAIDIFQYDRNTDTNTLVSHASSAPGTPASGAATLRGASSDGRFVLLQTPAANLVAGFVDNNGSGEDLYLWDRNSNASTLVSHAAGSPLAGASAKILTGRLAEDGSRAVFHTAAGNLVAGFTDRNGAAFDSFVFERASGGLQLVSGVSATATHDDGTSAIALSADGRYVFFNSSATDVMPGLVRPADDAPGIFRFDTGTRAIALINHKAGQPTAIALGDTYSFFAASDGEALAFANDGGELVAGQTGSGLLAFAYDMAGGNARLASHLPGQPLAGERAEPAAISADHRYVAFRSESANLVAGDHPIPSHDVFLYDQNLSATTRATSTTGSGLTASATGFDFLGSLPAAGLFLFHALDVSTFLPGTADLDDGGLDPVLFDPRSGTLTALVAPGGATPAGDSRATFAADGLNFLLRSNAPSLVPGMTDGNGGGADLYAGNRSGGGLQLISSSGGSATTSGNLGITEKIVLSASGRFVAYSTLATDAVAGVTDANGDEDVILHDRQLGTRLLVSRAASSPTQAAGARSFPVAMSPDGELLIFASWANNLIAGFVDRNEPQFPDYFLYRRSTGATSLLTHSAFVPTQGATGYSDHGRLSADGRYFVFASMAGNLVAGMTNNGANLDTFLYDTATGVISLVSHRQDSSLHGALDHVTPERISADGRFILLSSPDVTMTGPASFPAVVYNTFLYDRLKDRVTLVSHLPGQPATALSANSSPEAISDDGRYLVMRSGAPNAIAGQQLESSEPANNLFLIDRATGERTLVSHSLSGPSTAGTYHSSKPVLGPGARQILFLSSASNLALHQAPVGLGEVFLADLSAGGSELFRDGFELGDTSQWSQTVGGN